MVISLPDGVTINLANALRAAVVLRLLLLMLPYNGRTAVAAHRASRCEFRNRQSTVIWNKRACPADTFRGWFPAFTAERWLQPDGGMRRTRTNHTVSGAQSISSLSGQFNLRCCVRRVGYARRVICNSGSECKPHDALTFSVVSQTFLSVRFSPLPQPCLVSWFRSRRRHAVHGAVHVVRLSNG